MNDLPREQWAMGDIAYEVEMCAMSAYRYLTEADSHARNAYLECLLLHARALEEFLVVKHRNHKDDMLRTSFAPEWEPKPRDAVQRLGEQRTTINKHLAHLTWARARVDNHDAPKPQWAFIQIADDVVEVTSAWVQHVASSENRSVDDPEMTALHLWDTVKTAKGTLAEAHRIAGTPGSSPAGQP